VVAVVEAEVVASFLNDASNQLPIQLTFVKPPFARVD
jgi:hypothetical protein